MNLSQMDELAKILESSENDKKVRRAAIGPATSRRSLLLAIGALGTLGAGAVTVAAVNNIFPGVKNLPASAQSLSPSESFLSDSVSTEGTTVVLEESVFPGSHPVIAPLGVGAFINSDGQVVIANSSGVLAISSDITPEAVLVAGSLDGEDVVAWSTGRVMSWWTLANGIQRVEHSRPLGLNSVAGGILVFDDEDWSGRLDGNQVTQIISGSDSITIGVSDSGTAITANADAVLTHTLPNGEVKIVQPITPVDDYLVRRIVGIFSNHIILVWDNPTGDGDKSVLPVTVMNLDSGKTISQFDVDFDLALEEKLKRSSTGAAFCGFWIGTDGIARKGKEPLVLIDSVGRYLLFENSVDDSLVWVDVDKEKISEPETGVDFELRNEQTLWRLFDEKVIVERL